MKEKNFECNCLCHIMPSESDKFNPRCICCVECDNCGKRIRLGSIYRHSYLCSNNDPDFAADLNERMRMKYADKKWLKEMHEK